MNYLERFWLGCSHCRGGEDCPLSKETPDSEYVGEGPVRHGPPLVGVMLLVFVLPLAVAVMGAYLAGFLSGLDAGIALAIWQISGGIAGFFVGVLVARMCLSACGQFSASRGENR